MGTRRLGSGERPRKLLYRKGWALLAYLAVERRRHSRVRLAEMLWPELGNTAALTNLRQVLSDLKRAMKGAVGDGVLLIDRESVRLCPAASQGVFDIDLLDVGNAGADPGGAWTWLADAGELLEDLALENCDEFCEWLTGMRTWSAQRLLAVLERGKDEAAAAGDWDTAIRLARRLVALDPWNEAQQRGLMRLYLELGEPGMALDCYHALEGSLKGELGVEPQLATRALALEIRRHAQVVAAAPVYGRWPAASPPMRGLLRA